MIKIIQLGLIKTKKLKYIYNKNQSKKLDDILIIKIHNANMDYN